MSDWGASGSAVVREKSDVAKAVARLNDDTAPLWDLTIASEVFYFVCLFGKWNPELGAAPAAVTGRSGAALLRAVGKSTSLVALTLDRAAFDGSALCDALRRTTTLQSVAITPDLSGARHDSARTGVALIEALADARSLRDVALSSFFAVVSGDDERSTAAQRAAVTRAAARLLLVSERSAQLRSLAWTENLTWHEADFVRTLTHVARGNTLLRSLDLSNNEMSDGDVLAVADLLLRSTPLTALTMARCRLTGAHLSTLADALAVNTSLQLLSINGNIDAHAHAPAPGDAALLLDHPLARIVRSSIRLKQLDVSYCGLTNAILPPILDALADNRSLRTVSMFAYEHVVSDETGARFARVVRKNASLQQWFIVGHIMSYTEQLRFARNLWANRQLQALWFETAAQPGLPWFRAHWPNELMVHLLHNLERNGRVQPCVVWRYIVDVCLAIAPLRFPPYIVLEIVDRLPDMWLVDHTLKVGIAINVHRFYKDRTPPRPAPAAPTSEAPAWLLAASAEASTVAASTARPRANSGRAMRRLRDGKQRLSQILFRTRTSSNEPPPPSNSSSSSSSSNNSSSSTRF
jgi:hypothetical protein